MAFSLLLGCLFAMATLLTLGIPQTVRGRIAIALLGLVTIAALCFWAHEVYLSIRMFYPDPTTLR